MKNLNWILFTAFALALSACSKEDGPVAEDLLIQEIATASGRPAVEPADLPQPIQDFVRDVYFDTFIETAYLAPSKGYELKMGNGDNLFFGRDNTLLESRRTDGRDGPCHRPGAYGSPIAAGRLPNAVIRYVNATYPGSVIRRASVRSGYFIVAVDAPALLLFNERGVFVEELSPIRHCQDACRPVLPDQLPAAVPAYIRANYDDVTFRQACARSGRIVVWLTDGEGRIILVFSRDGNLLFVRE